VVKPEGAEGGSASVVEATLPRCSSAGVLGEEPLKSHDLHVNSKEIENWTWQTLWWQPGEDTPGGFRAARRA
jgi:hypothetical protein